MAETQVSTYISESTKQNLQHHAEAHDVNTGHLVEQALLHSGSINSSDVPSGRRYASCRPKS